MSQIEAARASLADDGFAVLESLIDRATIAAYRTLVEPLVAQAQVLTKTDGHFWLELDADKQPIAGMLHKVQAVCMVAPELVGLGAHPAIAEIVYGLLGPQVDFAGTKFFPKLPGGGTSTGWHYDASAFLTDTGRMLSCTINLDDADAANGCLRVIPGSHLREELPKPGDGAYGWLDIDDEGAVDVAGPAGTVVLFSTRLLHSAGPNLSDRTRFSTAWHYIPEDLDLPHFRREVYPDRFAVTRAGADA